MREGEGEGHAVEGGGIGGGGAGGRVVGVMEGALHPKGNKTCEGCDERESSEGEGGRRSGRASQRSCGGGWYVCVHDMLGVDKSGAGHPRGKKGVCLIWVV